MRQRFEQQISLGNKLISDVKFPLRSELPPVLKAFTPEINEKVFLDQLLNRFSKKDIRILKKQSNQ